MKPSLTITSLIVLVVGMFGLGNVIHQSEVSTVVNALFQLAGVIGVWYGRYRHGDLKVGLFKKF